MSEIRYSSDQSIQNSITVGQGGADFISIQEAIDSIDDNSVTNQYNILISAGIYEENIVMKNYVYLIGNGATDSIIIKGTSGSLITAPSILSQLENIRLELNPTADGSILFDCSAGGELRNSQVNAILSSSTNGITATWALIDNGAAFFYLRSSMQYVMSGSAAGVKEHNIIRILGNSSYVNFAVDFTVTMNDVDDTVRVIRNEGATVILNAISRFTLNHTNPSYTGTFIGLSEEFDTAFNTNETAAFFMIGSGGGTGIAIAVDSPTDNAEVDSFSNQYSVEGFATNYFASVATGDTLNTTSDFIIAEDNIIGDGIVNFGNSQEYGQLEITSGGEITINTASEWHALDTLVAGVSSEHISVAPGSNGVISGTLDNGGQLQCADVGHGLSTGDYIALNGMGNPAHNGITRVTVLNADDFVCDNIAFSSIGDTGVWQQGSYLSPTRRGAYRIGYAFSAIAAANNKMFDFAVFRNVTDVPGTLITNRFAVGGDAGGIPGTGVLFLEKDDILFFALRNTTDNSNITISEGSFNIDKVS